MSSYYMYFMKLKIDFGIERANIFGRNKFVLGEGKKFVANFCNF